MTDRTAAHPRRRHRDRRQPRPALRGRLTRGRAGRGHLRRRATSTRARSASTRGPILELAGRTDVEVALGREVPLVRPLETTPETHGPQGLGHAELPPPTPAALRPARRRPDPRRGSPAGPGEITLVTLGPLTNLALARPCASRRCRACSRATSLMGGAFGVPGNTTPTTEWNIHCDPDAAKIVFRAWAEAIAADPSIPRPVALGLDVTERARILPDDVVRLARRAGSTPDDSIALARGEDPMHATRSVASNPIVRYVADALRFYMEFHARYDGFYGAFIHDPLAVAAALDPSLVTTEPLYVDVETRGELTDRDDRGRPAPADGQAAEPRRRGRGRRRDVPGSARSNASEGWRRAAPRSTLACEEAPASRRARGGTEWRTTMSSDVDPRARRGRRRSSIVLVHRPRCRRAARPDARRVHGPGGRRQHAHPRVRRRPARRLRRLRRDRVRPDRAARVDLVASSTRGRSCSSRSRSRSTSSSARPWRQRSRCRSTSTRSGRSSSACWPARSPGALTGASRT